MHRTGRTYWGVLAAACCLLAFACDRPSAPTPSASSSSASALTAAVPQGKVERIAFIDQEESCECTKKRIDDSWAALQEAMKQTRQVPVQRLHRDSQAKEVEPLQAKRAFVTVPAIYLLNRYDDVIDVLQGEVTDKDIAAALK